MSNLKIRETNADQILPNLWLWNALIAKNKEFIIKNNIKYIINISSEIPNYFHGSLTYLNISINDSDISADQVTKIFEITNKFIYKAYHNNDAILVHCKRGHHRSAAIVAAFLIRHLNMVPDVAIKYINTLRRYTFTRETNLTKGLRQYYELIKTKYIDLKGGSNANYISNILQQINNLSKENAKFWYDVFVIIMSINNNSSLKNDYNVENNNDTIFKCAHHFFTFGIFDNIINNVSRSQCMRIYKERFEWKNFVNPNDVNHWAKLLLNYRSLDSSPFYLPEDESIVTQYDCLDNIEITENHNRLLENLFNCLVNNKTNLNTQSNKK